MKYIQTFMEFVNESNQVRSFSNSEITKIKKLSGFIKINKQNNYITLEDPNGDGGKINAGYNEDDEPYYMMYLDSNGETKDERSFKTFSQLISYIK